MIPAFFDQYPTIQELSRADTAKVTNLIKTLGLHRERAQLLVNAAKRISEKFGGEIPRSRTELEKIPGVGRYVSNAIRCYSYDEEVPLVDSNISRFLSRFYRIRSTRDPSQDEKMWKLAKQLLPTHGAREFNWALIDLGALICTPKNPKCTNCPVRHLCKSARIYKEEA